jgi:beta-lactamase regulating signal transducer with metallopeptidase domain
MNETLIEYGQAIFTGPWSTVWPVIVMPVLAVLLIGFTLKKIETWWSNPALQAGCSAVATCIPGAVSFMLAYFAIRSLQNTSAETWGCYVKLFGPLVIAGLLFLRAGALFYFRRKQLRALFRATHKPSTRLAELGKELGIPIRELSSSVPMCMVAGLFRPSVVISTGAAEQLEDWALRAALLHERAHIRNWDTLRSAGITFVSDCAPFGTKKALALYRTGREVLADREAAKHVHAVELAAVLVDFARNTVQVPLTQPLAQARGLEQRVRLLLENPCAPATQTSAVFPILAHFVSISSLGLYPLAARVIDALVFHCAP